MRYVITFLLCLFLVVPAVAGEVEDDITAADDFTAGVTLEGDFNISVTGTWAGTITLQRSFDRKSSANDAAATWEDVTDASFTTNVSKRGFEPEGQVFYRCGCKDTDTWTSGTATCRLSDRR